MTAVDTNILFYAHDPRDKRKQMIAVDLLQALTDGALLWHVACEYLWTSRKLEPHGFSYSDAVADIQGLRQAWRPLLPGWASLDHLQTLKSNSGFSHWDALLIGACLEAGVHRLISEDFAETRRIGPFEIVNPFI
jgi:predicted nucleic acid-binding protein